MIRLVGILTGLVFAFVVLLAFVTGAYTVATEGMGEETAEHAFHREAHLPAGTPRAAPSEPPQPLSWGQVDRQVKTGVLMVLNKKK